MEPLKEKILTSYTVAPWRMLNRKKLPTLRDLRRAVSRSWKGADAVKEIRSQRQKV